MSTPKRLRAAPDALLTYTKAKALASHVQMRKLLAKAIEALLCACCKAEADFVIANERKRKPEPFRFGKETHGKRGSSSVRELAGEYDRVFFHRDSEARLIV